MSSSGDSTTTPSPPKAPPAVIAYNLPFGSFGFIGFTSIEVCDLDQAEDFYTEVFGWEFPPTLPGKPIDSPSRSFTVPGAPIAGVIHLKPSSDGDEQGDYGNSKGKSEDKTKRKADHKTGAKPKTNKFTGQPLAKPVEDPVWPKLIDYIIVEDVDDTLNLAITKGALVLRDRYPMGGYNLAEIDFEGAVHGIMARSEPYEESVVGAGGVRLLNM